MNNTTTSKGDIILYWEIWSVYIILGVFIILGNSLICTMFVIWKSIRSPTNTFLAMLASADLLIGLVFIPLYIGGHFLEYYNTVNVTEHIDSVLKFVFFASVFNLHAVTLDRYIAVFYALRYNALMTGRTVTFIAVAAWLLPALITGILLIIKSTAGYENSNFVLFGMEAIFVIIPGFLMAYVYLSIFNAAKKQIKQVASLEVRTVTQQKEKVRKRKAEQKAAQICALLVTVFFICWIPTLVEQILSMAKVEIMQLYTDIAIILMIANSAVNPFLYGLTKPDIRSKLMIMFRYRRGRDLVDTVGRNERSSFSTHGASRKQQTKVESINMNSISKQENGDARES